MLTSHELARKLLEGPDLPVAYKGHSELLAKACVMHAKLNEARTDIIDWPFKDSNLTGFEQVVRLD